MAPRRAASTLVVVHVQKEAPKAVVSSPRGHKPACKPRVPCVLKPGTPAWERLWPLLTEPDPEDRELPCILVPRRPTTRAECRHGPRPCPWLSCPYHRYLSVNPRNGSIWLHCPDVLPWEMRDSCLLDVIEQRGELTLADVGELQNLTKERIRQIEHDGLVRLRAAYDTDGDFDGRRQPD